MDEFSFKKTKATLTVEGNHTESGCLAQSGQGSPNSHFTSAVQLKRFQVLTAFDELPPFARISVKWVLKVSRKHL